MKQLTISVLITILLICNYSYGQTNNSKKSYSLGFKETPKKLSDIVKRIASINEIQSEHIGVAGIESDNYKNYLELKKVANTEDLLNLTDNQNAVVACYASMALADKSYFDLKSVFLKFLSHDRKVSTFSGCIKSKDDISTELYYQYWNNVNDKAKWTDKILLQLDSIILYRDNSDWLLMTRALENRVYPASYKKRIEELAFKKGNRESLFYLCTWYRADNYENIKKSLITYLKKTDFSKTGTTDYYRTLDELLKFRDSEIETLIIQKLKKDKFWKNEEKKFISLLDDYSIYENFD
ncbi:hypothetical protein FC093_23305 [Ilyomonas limi]|uniref:Uncharacterized protein n=1 Tax=Ilyomonas limi TaxID=2575867 RepID=A0A4V5UUL2_9BACT|nr:hypothetical protein [Ilyomonas limi]TKK64103.1 hypothetical protein FC093_23305 [Ilyomonas limi]